MITPDGYYKKEIKVKLTQFDIDQIIECIENLPHKLFEFLKYQELIDKLKKSKKGERR